MTALMQYSPYYGILIFPGSEQVLRADNSTIQGGNVEVGSTADEQLTAFFRTPSWFMNEAFARVWR